MPLVNFRPAPGINKEVTDYTGQGKWTDGDMVRFFQGSAQKIKGWERFLSTTLVGVVRDQHAWIALDGTRYDAFGTDRKLYVFEEGRAYDITPLRKTTSSISNPFTTNATTSVVVTDTGHGAQKGDFVTFDSFSAIDGLDMNKEFEITSVANTNAYVVTATSAASGSTSGGGGTGNIKYQINIGPELSTSAFGWGTDTWGSSTWGTPSSTSNVTLEARQWSLDNFGQLLIATVLNGGAFEWSPTSGVSTRATAITNAPTASRLSLVSTPDRHVLFFGTESTIGTTNSQDDLLLRFSNQEDRNTYQPTAENTAGSLRIADGSRIVAAERSRGQILVWTDTSLHSLQFIGPPFTFGLRQLGQNCGIVGSHAGVDINGVSYWMSQDSFFLFDGSVKKLPCTVEQFVFNNINVTGSENAFAGHNGEFNEIMWFYPRTGSDQINAIVAYNYLEGTWWTGTLSRTTWIDREVYDNPIATEYSSTATANNEVISGLTDGASSVFLHETGNNGDGQAITAFVKSGVVQIAQGDEFAFVSKIIPDIEDQEGVLNAKLEFKNYPNNSTSVTKTTSFTDTTDFVSLRGRGREFTVNVVSNTTGTAWRLGTQRFDIQTDGRR
ncbi:MAG: hypothetical protein CMH18_09840 [Methylophaga sp.]|uniref:hypothetical protein n=1 Tax=Methylophaga sp. TaxID=2024840 RepID=UPI000C8930CB|nr:hypothetical protein [Methylophaga sp.]MAL50045.1 hypothetical protein [Methylophaga sp.]